MSWVPHFLHPLLFVEGNQGRKLHSITSVNTKPEANSFSQVWGMYDCLSDGQDATLCLQCYSKSLALCLMLQQSGAHYTKLLQTSSLLYYNFAIGSDVTSHVPDVNQSEEHAMALLTARYAHQCVELPTFMRVEGCII